MKKPIAQKHANTATSSGEMKTKNQPKPLIFFRAPTPSSLHSSFYLAKVWAMPSARAATASRLKACGFSCQHRIAIAGHFSNFAFRRSNSARSSSAAFALDSA